jgi:hypothetical protein
MVSDPDLSAEPPPWTGIDHTYFVVIDSNTDLFLKSIGYCGAWTYDARRAFIFALTERLARAGASLAALGPRIVQQAMYTFMSRVNRQASQEIRRRGSTFAPSCSSDASSAGRWGAPWRGSLPREQG